MEKNSKKTPLKRHNFFMYRIISFANVVPLILSFLTVDLPEIVLASKGAAYKAKLFWREPNSALCFPSESPWSKFSFSKIITVMSSFD